MSFHLPAVPELPEQSATIGAEGLLTRLSPLDPAGGSYIRAWARDPFVVEVSAAADAKQVLLSTNLGMDPGSDDWQDLPFTRVGRQNYRLELRLDRPGAYQFRVKFQLEGDKRWYWDRSGFGRVLVDPAWQRNLRMYTLIPTVSGTITDWTARLPEIAAMGFNALHLLPITRMDYSESPYCAQDLFAVDPHYVDPADPRDGIGQFSAFAERAAELGIRLCMDLVLNHVGPNSELATHSPDWLQSDPSELDGYRRAGWHDGTHWHKWRDLCLINYDHPDSERRDALWDYMAAYARFWSAFAAQTGGLIRLDNLHSGHEGAVTYILDLLRHDYPDLGILAELFTDFYNMQRLVWTYRLGLLLATPWEHRFLPQLRGYIDFVHSQSPAIHFFFPINSHDSGSPAQEFGHPDSTLPRYAVTALCGCGYTGLVQGVEYGVPTKIDFIGRFPRLRFAADPEHDYRAYITRINALMAHQPQCLVGGNLRFVDHGHEALLAAIREPPPGISEYLLIIANFDIARGHRLNVRLDELVPGWRMLRLRNLLDDEPTPPARDRLDLLLEPCEVRVYALSPMLP